jgi:hypothetical protein
MTDGRSQTPELVDLSADFDQCGVGPSGSHRNRRTISGTDSALAAMNTGIIDPPEWAGCREPVKKASGAL